MKTLSVVERSAPPKSETVPPVGRSCEKEVVALTLSISGASPPAGAPENAELTGSVCRCHPRSASQTTS